MKPLVLTVVLISCVGRIPGHTQDELRTVSLNFFAGGEWHGAPSSKGYNISNIIWTNHPAYCGGGPCIPYHYEKNLQGFGLSAGVGLRLKQLEIVFSPELRYDVIQHTYNASNNTWMSEKEFICNPRLGVQRWFKSIRAAQYLGLSYKVVNTRKEFQFFDNIAQVEKTFYLQVPSMVACYGRSIRRSRVYGEFQVYRFFKGLPHNPNGKFFMYGIALFSRLRV